MNSKSIPLLSCFYVKDFAFFIIEHPRGLYKIACIFWYFLLYSAQYDISLFLLCCKIGKQVGFFCLFVGFLRNIKIIFSHAVSHQAGMEASESYTYSPTSLCLAT